MMRDKLADQLQRQLQPTHLEVETEDDVHFKATVISEHFEGLNRIQRQQLVYSFIQPWLDSGELHALSLVTQTPAEYQT